MRYYFCSLVAFAVLGTTNMSMVCAQQDPLAREWLDRSETSKLDSDTKKSADAAKLQAVTGVVAGTELTEKKGRLKGRVCVQDSRRRHAGAGGEGSTAARNSVAGGLHTENDEANHGTPSPFADQVSSGVVQGVNRASGDGGVGNGAAGRTREQKIVFVDLKDVIVVGGFSSTNEVVVICFKDLDAWLKTHPEAEGLVGEINDPLGMNVLTRTGFQKNFKSSALYTRQPVHIHEHFVLDGDPVVPELGINTR